VHRLAIFTDSGLDWIFFFSTSELRASLCSSAAAEAKEVFTMPFSCSVLVCTVGAWPVNRRYVSYK
jgi:hypothetical protein